MEIRERYSLARSWPEVAIPPGELLAEELETRGMSQSELARRMRRPVQPINEIIRGVKQLTAETALQLEAVLGIGAHVWMRLEADYRLVKARLAHGRKYEPMKAGEKRPRRRVRLTARRR